MPGAMEGREDGVCSLSLWFSEARAVLTTPPLFSPGDLGSGRMQESRCSEGAEPALGDGWGTVVGVFYGELEGRGRLVTQGVASRAGQGRLNHLTLRPQPLHSTNALSWCVSQALGCYLYLEEVFTSQET